MGVWQRCGVVGVCALVGVVVYVLLDVLGGGVFGQMDPTGSMQIAVAVLVVAAGGAVWSAWRPAVAGGLACVLGVLAWFTAFTGDSSSAANAEDAVWLMIATALVGVAYVMVFRPLAREQEARERAAEREIRDRELEERIRRAVREELRAAGEDALLGSGPGARG